MLTAAARSASRAAQGPSTSSTPRFPWREAPASKCAGNLAPRSAGAEALRERLSLCRIRRTERARSPPEAQRTDPRRSPACASAPPAPVPRHPLYTEIEEASEKLRAASSGRRSLLPRPLRGRRASPRWAIRPRQTAPWSRTLRAWRRRCRSERVPGALLDRRPSRSFVTAHKANRCCARLNVRCAMTTRLSAVTSPTICPAVLRPAASGLRVREKEASPTAYPPQLEPVDESRIAWRRFSRQNRDRVERAIREELERPVPPA